MKRGWLLNDQLTGIPGTETLFSHLCREVDGLEPLLSPFGSMHREYLGRVGKGRTVDYAIRNASYFRALPPYGMRTIAFLQDPISRTRGEQVRVCEEADVVVCNSEAMRDDLLAHTKKVKRIEVIPIGVDFDLFKPGDARHRASREILFVGAASDIKGWDRMVRLIGNSDYAYNIVLKEHAQVPAHAKVIYRYRLSAKEIVEVMQASSLLVCTSRQETLHMAGVEAGACGVPAVAMDVGIYKDREDGLWGMRTTPEGLARAVDEAMDNLDRFNPRWYWLDAGMDLGTCLARWEDLINE